MVNAAAARHADATDPAAGAAVGLAARRGLPPAAHAGWRPAPGRPDPVALLERQARTCVPELVAIRHGRMLRSPLAFSRGAAAVMAADLAATPWSGLPVQTCGDAHLLNFGVFAAADRRPVFDVVDFDDTHPGPWEWDVMRLAASIEIAGRERGLKRKQRRRIVAAAVRQYREALRAFSVMGNLEVWYARLDAAALVRDLGHAGDRDGSPLARRKAAGARREDPLRAVAKLTRRAGGRARIVGDPPLVVPVRELLAEDEAAEVVARLRGLLDGYRRSLSGEHRHLLDGYRVADVAREVVGVGGVGTRAWIVLLEGRDARDALVLQAKEARPSVLAAHAGTAGRAHQGRRVVEGQRLIQAAPDVFLGWDRVTGADGRRGDFHVRQLWEGAPAADPRRMGVDRITVFGKACGWALARAHARSGDRVAMTAYLGDGDELESAMVAFARDYADQNERDHAALVDAVRSGRITAQTGV